MAFTMPAADQLTPDGHTATDIDLSALDDPSDLIEGNCQPIRTTNIDDGERSDENKKRSAEEAMESAKMQRENNGPDMSVLDEPTDEQDKSETTSDETAETTEPEVVDTTFSTRHDWPEGKEPSNVLITIDGADFAASQVYVVEYIDKDGSVVIKDDSGEVYGLEDGEYQVVTWADVEAKGKDSGVGEDEQPADTSQQAEEPRREFVHHGPQSGITQDHDRLIRLYNVELGIRKIEARIEDIKSDLKAEKERLDDQISYMRQLVSENDADENDAARPLLNAKKPNESALPETPTPTPETSSEERWETTDDNSTTDDADTDDNSPGESDEVIRRPLLVKVIISQDILDDTSDESKLTSGAEYDVVDLDESGDPIIKDDEGVETLLSADEFEVVEWSEPIRVDDAGDPDDGKPVISKFDDWPEDHVPSIVSISDTADDEALTNGKHYPVVDVETDIEDDDGKSIAKIIIKNDFNQESELIDGEYLVVEWSESWESVPIEELKLPAGVQSALLIAGKKTIGQLEKVREEGNDFTVIPGIGEAKGKKIEDAFEAFWAKRKK